MRSSAEETLSGDTWTTLNRYIWEGDSHYSPLAWASIGGNNRYYLYDGLGSTRQLLNDDQTVTDAYTYEAFGNLMGSTGSTVNPYKYVGSLGYYQTGSSLMHLGARYYMPELGRFLAPGSPYAYANNDPANSVQASGGSPVWTPGWRPSIPGQPYPFPGWIGRPYDPTNPVNKPTGYPTLRGRCAEETWPVYESCIKDKKAFCANVSNTNRVKFQAGHFDTESPDIWCFLMCMNRWEVADCWARWGEAIQRCMASARP